MRDGLRSRDLSGQLEGKDDVLLSSLVRKKGKKLSGGAAQNLVFESKKVKKRLRLTSSDSDSDNELLVSASRKVGRKNDGDGSDFVAVVVETSNADSRKRKRKTRVEKKKSRSETVKCSEEAEISEDGAEKDGNDGDGSDSIVVEKSNVDSRKPKRKSGVEKKRGRPKTVKWSEEAEISEDEAEKDGNNGDGSDSIVVEKSNVDSRKPKRKSGVEKKRGRPKTVKWSEEAEICEDEAEKDGNDGDGSDSIVVEKSNVDSRKPKRKSRVEKKRRRIETVEWGEEAEISEDEGEQDGNDIKRSRLDIFEYNEDDLVDYKNMKKEIENERGRGVGADKRKRSKNDKKKRLLVERNRGVDLSDEDKCEIEEDKTIRSAGTSKKKYKVSRKNRITRKGENGDSPVLVDKKMKVDRSEKTFDHSEAGINRSPRSAGSSIGKRTQSSVKSKKSLANPCPPATREKHKSPKRLSAKKNKQRHEKEERNKGEATSTSEFPKIRKLNEAKQLIRDQLKRLIESAGWTIDYRPRRDKDYQDAVYIDHAGRAYWSVLKAYYALEKQCQNKETDQKTGFSFTPVPKEVLNKLTRLTKRRMERENIIIPEAEKGKRKAKGASEKESADKKIVKKRKGRSMSREKLNSLNRQGGKSLKAGLKKDGFNLKKKNGVKRPTFAHNSDKGGNGKHNGMLKLSNAHLLQGRKSKTRRGYTLLVRKSNKEVNSDGDHLIAYTEKRTVLSWLIDSDIVSIGGKVKYMNKRRSRALVEGCITRDGINCGCCNEIVTISEFETHAGSKLCQPCQNIFDETGVPLFQCQIDAWNKQEESERNGYRCIDISSDDPNDDTCGICGDGGDLICCDGCPSTFHQSCLGIQVLPKGDWHCFNCCCKFCGIVGCSNDQENNATISKLLTCSLCEEKYHGSCILQKNTGPVDSDSLWASFCGQKCRELFEQLQKLLGVKHELEAGFSWTLIQRSDLESDTSLCELPQKVECNSKLALALSVMDECFLPTIDERTGISLIHNVVYNCGSNFNRLNYIGFYTFILEKHDEIISAATIRIHGTRFAEMPFIGTRHIYRRQGMCRRLLNAIESSLSSLNVEKLIIPAISELMDTWTIVFGFSPLEESYKHEVRSLNMVVFPGVDLLQKLLKHNSAVAALNDVSVLKAVELERDDHFTAEATDNSAIGSVKPDIYVSDVIADKVVFAKTGSQAAGDLVQNTSDASNASDLPGELILHAPEEEPVCYTSQSRKESISITDSVLPEAEENSTMNCSVDPNLHASSIEGPVEYAQKVNIKMDSVESDPRSLAETSSLQTTDVLEKCLNLYSPEEGRGGTECHDSQSRDKSSVSTTETKALLTEVENEHSKNSYVKSCGHDSVEGAANDVQEVSIIIDGVESDLHSLDDIAAQHKTDALNECLDMQSPEEETECCNSQSRNESFIHEAKNEPAENSHVESSGHDSVEGAVSDVHEVNMVVDGIESDTHHLAEVSSQHTTDVLNEGLDKPKEETECYNSKLWNESSVLANETESLQPVVENKPTMNSSAEPNIQACIEGAVDHDQEVNMRVDGVGPDLESSSETSAQCTTGVLQGAAFVQDFQEPGKTVLCADSESKQSLKTDFKCNLEESLEAQGAQLLNLVGNLCKVENEVAVTEKNPKSLGDDSLDCTCEVMNCMVSVECKGHDFLPNSCHSFEVPVLHASKTAREGTHDVGDESLIAFPGDSILQDPADGNGLATHCEGDISLDRNSHVLHKASQHDSLDTATEPIIQISSGSTCTSVLLRKVPGSICSTGSKCIRTPVELNPRGSGEDNGLGILNFKDEVDLVQTDATTFD